jgi:DDE superfamily endonuclease
VRTLPATMIRLLVPFAPLFSKCVWQNAQVLLMGVILAPGRRTVSSALRAMGLDRHKRFHRYHRVLSRASRSSLKASRVLLGLLVEMFVADEDLLIVGVNETLERRWGKKITAKGVYTSVGRLNLLFVHHVVLERGLQEYGTSPVLC